MNRGRPKDIVFLRDGKELSQDAESFCTKNNIQGVIRLVPENFRQLDKCTKVLTHFNLGRVGHVIGRIYALPQIVRPGYHHRDEDEVLPVLSFENCLIAECQSVRQEVAYELLEREDFKNSFPSIQSGSELKREMVRRYRQSLPSESEEGLLAMGVAITTLDMISSWEEYVQ